MPAQDMESITSAGYKRASHHCCAYIMGAWKFTTGLSKTLKSMKEADVQVSHMRPEAKLQPDASTFLLPISFRFRTFPWWLFSSYFRDYPGSHSAEAAAHELHRQKNKDKERKDMRI